MADARGSAANTCPVPAARDERCGENIFGPCAATVKRPLGDQRAQENEPVDREQILPQKIDPNR